MKLGVTVLALCLSWASTAWGDYQLPKSNKAVLIDVRGTGGPDVVSKVRRILEKRGWRVEVVPGDVQSLRTKIKDVGFLWISTHGIDTTFASRRKVFSLMADEVVQASCPFTAAVCKDYRDDRAAERLIGSAFMENDPTKYFGITGTFIAHYWTFAQDAVVVIDGCDALKPRAAASEVLQGLATQPVAVVYGWDGSVYKGHARKTIPLMLDRWLGGNIEDPEKKPQRPFDVASVYGWLDRTGLTRDKTAPDATAVLRAAPLRAGVRSLMAPSLQSLSVDEDKELLILSGQFGARDSRGLKQQVLVQQSKDEPRGETELVVKSWSDEEIIAEIPRTGHGAAGYVVVRVNGIHSNGVPLTLLTGTAFQKVTMKNPPGLVEEASCSQVRVRGDFHTWRKEPGGGLFVGDRGTSSEATGAGRVIVRNAIKDSTCTAKGYGGAQMGDTTYELLSPKDPTFNWREYNQPADYNNGWFVFLTAVRPVSRKMNVTWNMQHMFPLVIRSRTSTSHAKIPMMPAMIELQRTEIDLGSQLELPESSWSLTNQAGFPTDVKLEFRSSFSPSDQDEG